jgi:ribonuclease P protein component
LGVVASRKIGNAVQRNRAKRLVREAFRATRDLFAPGLDIVVIVRGALGRMKLDDLVGEWRADAARIDKRSREARSAAADARRVES